MVAVREQVPNCSNRLGDGFDDRDIRGEVLHRRRNGRADDWCPCGSGFDHRKTEPLVTRKPHEHIERTVETSEIFVAETPEIVNESRGRPVAHTKDTLRPVPAGNHSRRGTSGHCCLESGEHVICALARNRRDQPADERRRHVDPVGPEAEQASCFDSFDLCSDAEPVVDARLRYNDARRVDQEALLDLGKHRLTVDNHHRRRLRQRRQQCSIRPASAARKPFGVNQRRNIVQCHHMTLVPDRPARRRAPEQLTSGSSCQQCLLPDLADCSSGEPRAGRDYQRFVESRRDFDCISSEASWLGMLKPTVDDHRIATFSTTSRRTSPKRRSPRGSTAGGVARVPRPSRITVASCSASPKS